MIIFEEQTEASEAEVTSNGESVSELGNEARGLNSGQIMEDLVSQHEELGCILSAMEIH